MSLLSRGNAVLNEDTFTSFADREEVSMTTQGAIEKSILLVGITVICAFIAWSVAPAALGSSLMPLVIGASILGTIMSIVISSKPSIAPTAAPIFAVIQGVVLGVISLLFETAYSGIVFSALVLTIGTLFGMLTLWRLGVIQVTDRYRSIVGGCFFAIFLVYAASFALNMFGVAVPYLHDSGPIGIGISVFVLIIASLKLAMDFELITAGEENQMPRYMEWYAGFALLVTLIWIYIEFLRLLAKLRQR